MPAKGTEEMLEAKSTRSFVPGLVRALGCSGEGWRAGRLGRCTSLE